MRNYEATGRTVEEAISAGLAESGLSFGDVDIQILDEGSKGLFGLFGSRMARVRLVPRGDDGGSDTKDIFRDSLREKPAPRPAEPARKPEPAEAPPKAPDVPRQPRPERGPDAPRAPRAPRPAEPAAPAQAASARPPRAPKPADPAAPGQAAPARPPRPPRAPQPAREGQERRKPQQDAQASRPPRQGRPRPGESGEGADNGTPIVMPASLTPKNLVEVADPQPESPEGIARDFLTEMTRLMGMDIQTVMSKDEEGHIYARMDGDPQGILIGRRGETLDAMQYLTSLKVNRGREEYVRVTLDSEGYRRKREEALVRLANRMANRARKTGKRVAMEPMNPYERRIFHSALQAIPGIVTHSEGEEPNRHVVITPVEIRNEAAGNPDSPENPD